MNDENLPLPTDPVITITLPDELLGTTLPDSVINSNIRNLGIQNESLDMGNFNINNVNNIISSTFTSNEIILKDQNNTISETSSLHREDNILYINNTANTVTNSLLINSNGVLSVNVPNYDTLLNDNNQIPNKKYVDDNSGDNLGNHTATQTLNMNENSIQNINNGSSATPSISFHASTTTGLFSSDTNHIDFTNNSTHSLRIHNTGLIESQIPSYENLIVSNNCIPNKLYIDNIAKGLQVKASCHTKTVSLLPAYVISYSGSVKVLTASVNGALPNIDDHPMQISDRILIDQNGVADTRNSGIYIISNLGSPTTKWSMIRAADLDENSEFQNGVFTFITNGTLSANKGYILIIPKNAIIDINTQTWSEFTTTGDNLGDHIATTTLSMNNNIIEDLADGTESSPAISFNNSPGTGIYSPAVNQIAITTNQHKKLKITSTGLITADVTDGVSNIYTSLVNADNTNTALTNKDYVLNRFLSSNFYIQDTYKITFDLSGLSQNIIATVPNAATISLNSASDLFGNTLKSTVINSSLQNLGTQNAELNLGNNSIKNISYLLSNTNTIFGLNSTGRTFTDNAILGKDAGLSFTSNNNTILGSNAGNFSTLVGDVLNLNSVAVQNSVLLGYYAGSGLTLANYDFIIGSGNSINNQLIHGNFDNLNRNFSPAVDSIIELGTTTKKWKKIYANEIEATNLTITGNTVFVNTETLTIEDNIIQLNSSLSPLDPPPSGLYGGIEINRGSSNKYWFVFHENSQAFKIGEVTQSGGIYNYSGLQPVATREESPNNNCVAIWDNASKKFVTNTTYSTSTLATQNHLLAYQPNITVTGGLNFSSNNLQVKPELYYNNEFKFSSSDILITTNRTIILSQNYTPSSSSRYSLLLYVEFYIFDTNTTANSHYLYYDAIYHNKLSSDSTETEFSILNSKYNYNTNITVNLSLTNSIIHVKINNSNPENKRVNILAGLKYISNGTISFGSLTTTNNSTSISNNSTTSFYNKFDNALVTTGNITTISGTTANYTTINTTTGNFTTTSAKNSIISNSFETGYTTGTLTAGNRIAIANLPYTITNPISLSLEVNIELMDTTGASLYKTTAIFVYLSKSNTDSVETAMSLVSRFDSSYSTDSIRATIKNTNIYFYYQLADTSAGNKYISITKKIKYSCLSAVTFTPNNTLTISSSLITALSVSNGYYNTYNLVCNQAFPTKISNVLASSGFSSVSCSEISDSRLYITPLQVYGTTAGVGLNYLTAKTTTITRSGIQALFDGADKWRTTIDFNTTSSGLTNTVFYTYNSAVDNSSNNWGMVERLRITNSTDSSSKTSGTLQVTGGMAISQKIYAGAATFDSLNVGTGNVGFTGHLYMNDKSIYFRGDSNHGMEFHGASNLWNSINVNGPVIYGQSGGILGNTNGSAQNINILWTTSGNTLYGTTKLNALTASTLLALDANKNIISLTSSSSPTFSSGGLFDVRFDNTNRLAVFMDDNTDRSAPLQVVGNSSGIGLSAATFIPSIVIGPPYSATVYVRCGMQVKSQQDQQWRIVNDYDCWSGGPANQYFYTYNSGTTETTANRYGMTQRLQITNLTDSSSKTSGTLQVTGGMSISQKIYAGAATFDSLNVGTTNLNSLTASRLLALDASKNIVALTSSSTPSFTSVIGTTSLYSTYGIANSSSYTSPSIYTLNGDAGGLAFNAIADINSPYYTKMAIQGRSKPGTNRTNVWRNLIQWDCWTGGSVGHLTNMRIFTHYDDGITDGIVQRMIVTSNTAATSLTNATVAITGGLAVDNGIITNTLTASTSSESFDINKYYVYPPYGMISATTSYTHSYCNGNVTISTSSDNTSSSIQNIMDRTWRNTYGSSILYSTTSPYNYTGATNYFGTYAGVWFKFSFPEKFILKYFGIYGSEGGGIWASASPYKYKIYGGNNAASTNIADWTLLIDNNTPAFTGVIYQYFDLTSNTNGFNTYLMIINAAYGSASYGGTISIGEIIMAGNPLVQHVINANSMRTVDKIPADSISSAWSMSSVYSNTMGANTQVYNPVSGNVVIYINLDDDIILINNTAGTNIWIVLPDSLMYKTMTKIYTIKDIGGNAGNTEQLIIAFKSANPNEKLDGVTYYPSATQVSAGVLKTAANLSLNSNYGYVRLCVNAETGWHIIGRDSIIPKSSTLVNSTTTGQIVYNTTENLPMFYNGYFWQYIGMEKQISYVLIGTSAPWAGFNSSNLSVNLQIFTVNNDGYYSLQLQVPAANHYITLDFGSLPRGKYKLRTTFLGHTDRAIVNITEMTTSTTLISSLDTYRNTGNNVLIFTDYVFMFNPSSSPSTLKIKYNISGKNASSTHFHILINNAVELLQVG